jgi:hypothetical protein
MAGACEDSGRVLSHHWIACADELVGTGAPDKGTKMTIRCDTMTNFLDVIQGLTERGLKFLAYADTLKIELSGAY